MTKKYIFGVVFLFASLFSGCSVQSTISNTNSEAPTQNLSSTEIPSQEHVTFESGYTFGEYNYSIIDGYIRIERYIGNDINVVVPTQIDGKPVKVLGDNSFYQRTAMKTIVLPESLTMIEYSAFYRCYSLTSVNIPLNVEVIGENPFFHCSSLTQIAVDPENKNFSTIDGVLFDKDESVLISYPEGNSRNEYTIPDSVIKIADASFGYRCVNLMNITIPPTVVEFYDSDMFFNKPETVLYVKSNSAAERYAINNELNYKNY